MDQIKLIREDAWVDVVLSPTNENDALFAALRKAAFRDEMQRLQLGALDQSLARILFWLLRQAVSRDSPIGLNIELPRGDHEVAILIGILTQVARFYARASAPGSPTDFPGSVSIIGMDTAAQRRLAAVSVEGVQLSEGLQVHRVRSDGRLVRPGGEIVPFQPGTRRLLYLNSRVGWPKLRNEHDGVAIIDRTSFSNARIFRHALDWSKNHQVNRVVVLSDRGDRETVDTLAEQVSEVFHWNVDGPIRQQLAHIVRPEPSRSRLSTNVLLCCSCPVPLSTVVEAPDIESRARRCFSLLQDAYTLDAPLPHGVSSVRHILNVLNQLVGTVESFNESAALDHRSRSIRSLARTVEQTSSQSFPRDWHGFASTRWEALKRLTLELVEHVTADNPKFMGLLATIDLVARRMPGHAVVIRVASEAAATALLDDLHMFENDLPDAKRTVLSWAKRLPWTDTPTVELLPALPPPSRHSLLWSGEATDRILIGYRWEQFVLERIQQQDAERIEKMVAYTFAKVRLGNPPVWPRLPITVFETVQGGPRVDGELTAAEMDVNLDALTAELDELDTALGDEGEASHGTVREYAEWEIRACSLTLEPSGDVWWVHCDAPVETLIAGGSQ